MRRLILFGFFLILTAMLYGLWQFRFERASEFPDVQLSDLKTSVTLPSGVEWAGTDAKPNLILRANPASGGVVTRFDLPFSRPVDFLLLRVQLAASGLVPGQQIWQDGRGLIEWHPANGGEKWEKDQFGSARFDQMGDVCEVVMRPDNPPAIPALRLENLGLSGELKLSVFEASVLKERLIWKIGRWFLMVGWAAWAVAWIRLNGGGEIGRIRALFASIIWLIAGLCFVVPGPWKIHRPFGQSFELGESCKFSQPTIPVVSASHNRTTTPNIQSLDALKNDEALKSVGEIPDKGDFVLRFKHFADNLRPLLHALLLFGPTLLISVLIGKRPTLSLVIILALSIEAAQFAFGYGFDATDIGDLGCDAIGITLALGVQAWLLRIFPQLGLNAIRQI